MYSLDMEEKAPHLGSNNSLAAPEPSALPVLVHEKPSGNIAYIGSLGRVIDLESKLQRLHFSELLNKYSDLLKNHAFIITGEDCAYDLIHAQAQSEETRTYSCQRHWTRIRPRGSLKKHDRQLIIIKGEPMGREAHQDRVFHQKMKKRRNRMEEKRESSVKSHRSTVWMSKLKTAFIIPCKYRHVPPKPSLLGSWPRLTYEAVTADMNRAFVDLLRD
ncbi:hypothetical protein F5146DRAFT_1002404 [Armillaria mellea]|nr:hypothetical protein F5146DRAFT_1002404 [Armillaria mellea]